MTSGTIMHGTKLPMLYWFIAIHLLTATKKTFSAAELQRQLGHKRYQPIWELMHKLRNAMGKRDSEYKLLGGVELDEGFFSTQYNSEEPLKKGRGSQAKTKVLVMAESEYMTDSKKNIRKSVGHIKMVVIPNLKAQTIDIEVTESIDNNASLTTDDSTSYVHLKNLVKEHSAQVINPKDICKLLPWVHIMISNAKRQLLDIYHSIKPEFLQNYLNEFCYKFNRRYCDLFDRLIFATAAYQNDFVHRTYRK